MEDLIADLPGEIVIHFRIASVGEVTPKLCHPFPVTACATTRLSGHARAALFHNGTWSDWRETLRRMPRHQRPDGLLSDTRVAASLVDLCGMDVLDRLPGRWVFFDRDFTELYGDWREWQGMRASNLYFLPLRDDSQSSSHRSAISHVHGHPRLFGSLSPPHVPTPTNPRAHKHRYHENRNPDRGTRERAIQFVVLHQAWR